MAAVKLPSRVPGPACSMWSPRRTSRVSSSSETPCTRGGAGRSEAMESMDQMTVGQPKILQVNKVNLNTRVFSYAYVYLASCVTWLWYFVKLYKYFINYFHQIWSQIKLSFRLDFGFSRKTLKLHNSSESVTIGKLRKILLRVTNEFELLWVF